MCRGTASSEDAVGTDDGEGTSEYHSDGPQSTAPQDQASVARVAGLSGEARVGLRWAGQVRTLTVGQVPGSSLVLRMKVKVEQVERQAGRSEEAS